MTNLKKTLAVVLAFAMILSMGAISTFAAYSDVEAGTVVSEAVSILSNLDIFTGFEDGTFRPDETVTRAQMAAIICRMLGYEDQAQSSMGSTVFNDVAADHWASGYVNVAQAQGIINGYGDGNFGPEDKVTYEQAIKMIVSALGYDLVAAAKGGYPTGYLAIASAEGISKQANGKVGDAAARGTIAVLVYNALEVQLMDQSSWTTDGTDEYKKTNDTILSKYLEVTKWEGIVTNTALTEVAGNTYDPDATPKAKIVGYFWDYVDGKLVKCTTMDDNSADSITADSSLVDADSLLGKSVVAYIGEDDLTGDDTIYAIALNKNKNDSFKISATQLVEADEKYWSEAKTIGYKEVGASKIKDITLADNAKVFVNYDAKTLTDADTTQEIATIARRGGAVEFISNDADSDYEYVLITAYDGEAVIEEVEEANGIYKFNLFTGRLDRIDVDDEDALVIIYKDGEIAAVEDLAANDTVSFVEIARNLNVYYASSATVTGTVDSYDTDNSVVTISGEDYQISAASSISDVSRLSGEEGTFFLNVDGQIAHNETVAVKGNYALVLAAYDAESGADSGEYLQVVLADGTLAEYKINTTAKVYNFDNTQVSTDVKAYFDAKLNGAKSKSSAKFATVADLMADKDLMVRLTISNDKITKVKLLEGLSDTAAATDKYDAEAMSVGNKDLDDATIIFSAKQTSGVVEAEDIVIGTAKDFFVDDEPINGAMVLYDEDDTTSIFGAAVGFGLTKAIDAADSLFIVTGKKTTTIDDGDAYILTGIKNGEEVQVTVYDEDEEYATDPANVVIGDILLLAEANAEGIVSDIYRLVAFDKSDASAVVTASEANEDDDIYSGYGAVTASLRNKFAIGAAITNDYDSTAEVAANEEISYRAAAVYTLVDFSENAKNPEVSIESGSEWLFDTAEFESYAYVRYVEGRLAEVVVYRMAEVVAP